MTIAKIRLYCILNNTLIEYVLNIPTCTRILSVSDAVHSVRSVWSNMQKGRGEVCGTTALRETIH